MDQIESFVVRNQSHLFAIVAFVTVLVMLKTASWDISRTPYLLNNGKRSLFSQVMHQLFDASVSRKTRFKGWYFSLIIAVSIGLATFDVSRQREPIPKTTWLSLPALDRDSPDSTKLLIFVHGWNGDPQETWERFPQLVVEDPSYDAFNVLRINYPTFMVGRGLNVQEMAGWLNDQLKRKKIYSQYSGIWIIAHSMGGLIAREILIANKMGDGSNQPYKLLIEIATPHQGAYAASITKELGLSEEFSSDLESGSPFLASLQDQWNRLKDRPKTLCLSSPQDHIVTRASATAQCDEFKLYPQWGHTEMVKPQDITDERYAVPMSRIGTF